MESFYDVVFGHLNNGNNAVADASLRANSCLYMPLASTTVVLAVM